MDNQNNTKMIIKYSIKQSEILLLLFKFRGATADQLARALYGSIDGNRTKTYELLKKLEKQKLIEYIFNENDINSKPRRIYFLSKYGLQQVYETYDIEENHIGSGFFKDFGYFSHKLYKPPTKGTEHYLKTVDCMIDVYVIMQKYQHYQIDFAHNLYVNSKAIVKPDFKIIIKDKIFYVEIDLGNERGEALDRKFKRYNQYLDSDETIRNQSGGIYFIVPDSQRNTLTKFDSHQQIRFEKVSASYKKHAPKYLSSVDLCFIPLCIFYETLKNNIKTLESKDFPPSTELVQSIVKYLNKKFRRLDIFKISQSNIPHVYLIKDTTNNKILFIITEINIQSTKIWFDLLKLQNKYSINVQHPQSIIDIEAKEHIPQILIYTSKKNLKDSILKFEDFPMHHSENKKRDDLIEIIPY